jgi:TonB-dependent Receptor Plug Domain
MRVHFTIKALIFTIIISPIVSFSLKAQYNTRGIFIISADSKLPLQEVSIKGIDANFNSLTDDNGFIDLKKLPDSAKKVSISCIGFQSDTVVISSLTFLKNIAIINLAPKISGLQEIKIIASANRGIFKTLSDLDVHLRPINNSQELLRMVPGLFIGQHAGGGKAEQLFLRGFDLDHGTDINISVDGIPVNMVSHAHGQGYADLHFVIPELIDKVNFNKGPYYADKGNFTTAGFVAFKTKDHLENNFIKSEIGQYGTFRVITGINILKPTANPGTRSLYFAGESSVTKGYFDSPQDFSRFNGMLKYHIQINSYNTLTAMITGFTSRWNASGQIPERAVALGLVGFYGAIDNTEGGKTSRHNANIVLQTRLGNGAILCNQIYYSRYKFELYSNFTFFKEDPVNGDQIRQKESRNMAGYNGSYQKEYHIGNLKTETKAGLQVRYDAVDNIELTRTKNRMINTAAIKLGDINEWNAGAYWSQRLSVSKQLDITGACRVDFFNNRYDDKLNIQTHAAGSTMICPKINFNYYVSDKIQLYLYNGRGFHSNDTRVAILQDGKKVLPPAYGSDAGGVFKLGKKLIVQSAFWYLWLDQEFIYVGDEGVVAAGGPTRRIGFDFSARYEVAKNLFADADISLAAPRALRVAKAESYLPLAPQFTSAGGLTYRKEKGWNGSLRYRLMNNRPANENNTVIAKGYCILDAAINYTKKKWEAGLSVQNLLNTRWKETQFYTESRLQAEAMPVSEIHFTPGTPFFARLSFTIVL